jgi:serine/threonine protein phosphatase PrpC
MPVTESGVATDIGNIRTRNEDSALAKAPIFAVADGMGGHAAGDVASVVVVSRLSELATRADLSPGDVREQIAEANRDILDHVRQEEDHVGMGTTVTGMCLVKVGGIPHWVVFNVGDSRVYRYAGGVLAMLTVDHSEVAELVATGVLEPAEADAYPRRNIVTRALGTDPAPELDLWLLPPVEGDRFLICSDGLTGELSDEEITEILAAHPAAQEAAETLVRCAIAAGGRDNVTVVVVDHRPSSNDEDLSTTAPRARSGA